MREVLDQLEAWIAVGDRVAVGTVVETRRSAPRPPGAKMAINARGDIAGGVSGGCVEGAVASAAIDGLRNQAGPRLLHFGIADSDAWDVGLPCGGEIDVFVEEFCPTTAGPEGQSPQAEFARIAREDERGVLATVVGPMHHAALGRKLLVREGPKGMGGLGSEALDLAVRKSGEQLLWAERSELRDLEGAQVFFDLVAPPPRLLILGAIDYAAALCRMAKAMRWRPFICDPRTAFATNERFPEADAVLAAWPDEAFARLGVDPATYIAVLTHDPKLDDAALRIALRSDAAYVGAMGSRRTQARRWDRLRGEGLTEDELARLAAPIGLDLGATTPEETALSVLAEIVAVRNGHEGGRLGKGEGRIHGDPGGQERGIALSPGN